MGSQPRGGREGEEGPLSMSSSHVLFLLPRTKRQLQRFPLSPLPVPSFPTCSPHSAFPSLRSGPPGPVIIRKGGRRGAILAHQEGSLPRELGLRAGDTGLPRCPCLSSLPAMVPPNTGRPCPQVKEDPRPGTHGFACRYVYRKMCVC